MALHNELGRDGEDAACDYLINKGYTIRERNWRCGRKELDIIAMLNDELIVVEVKTRRNSNFGEPEESVINKKIKRIVASTDAYLKKYAIDNRVRFDIISVLGEKPPFEINHIIDAFYPPIWK